MTDRRFQFAFLLTAAVALLLLLVDAALLVQGWLVVTLTWGAVPLGALAILMAHGLTGGHWGEQSRPVWLTLAATVPLFAVSMVLLLPGMDILFPWTRPAHSLPEVVQNKRLYLNPPFFVVRTLVFVLLWLMLAGALGVWAADRRPQARVHAPGLILWVLAVTFFGFDWLQSLEPEFYSDIFGLMLGLQMITAAMAAGIAFLAGGQNARTGAGALRDLANLWLALLLGWVFMAFSQYIIIWSGNLPDEIGWYLDRREGPWGPVGVVSFGLFFLLPFCVLLSSGAKGSRRWLSAAAVTCLAGHGLQVFWLVLPPFGPRPAWHHGLVAALVVAGGAGYLLFTRSYQAEGSKRRPAAGPTGDKGEQHV